MSCGESARAAIRDYARACHARVRHVVRAHSAGSSAGVSTIIITRLLPTRDAVRHDAAA